MATRSDDTKNRARKAGPGVRPSKARPAKRPADEKAAQTKAPKRTAAAKKPQAALPKKRPRATAAAKPRPKPLRKPESSRRARRKPAALLSAEQAHSQAKRAIPSLPPPPAADTPTPGKVAAERRRLERREKLERKRRIKVFQEADRMLAENRQEVLAAGPTALAAAAAAPQPLRILAEGDSWFDYPNFRGAGVIWQLENTLQVNALFLNLAKAGDEARYMLGVDERKVLSDQLKLAVDRGRPFDALLFSGGGNDIVGSPLVLWLKTFAAGMTADQVVDTARFDAAAGLVLAAYEDLIQVRDAISPGTAIFLHAYDHAIPDGRGICGFGPWLQPSLKARGVPEGLRREVVKSLLSRFAAKLQALASDARKIYLVPTQGALLGHDGWWDNELHPNADGFRAIARKFRDALRAVFPGRV